MKILLAHLQALALKNKAHNKALHSDKIKLRSFLTTLYFAGELGRYVSQEHYMANPDSSLVSDNSSPRGRYIFRAVVAIAGVILIAIIVTVISVIQYSTEAEANLHAFFRVHRACCQFVQKNTGAWPSSWDDLRRIDPETDFASVAKRVSFDFEADPKTLATQTPESFTAIVPNSPCYVYDSEIQSLISLLRSHYPQY